MPAFVLHRLPTLPSLLLLTAFLAACSSDPTGPTVASVEVVPGSVTLRSLGATQQFTAEARDGQGTLVDGEAVSWSSDAPEVASVTASGTVTALAAGVARIEATVAGISGQATLTVVPPNPECTEPAPVELPVGGHTVLGSQECFLLPSGSAGDAYRVVLLRPDSGGAQDVVEATLSVEGIGVATAPPAPDARAATTRSTPGMTSGLARTLRRSVEIAEATEAHHARLRTEEARLIRDLGSSLRLAERSAGPFGAAALQGESPSTIRVNPATSCSEGSDATGVHIYSDERLAFYQDSAQNLSSPVTRDQARRLADYYDRYGRDVVRDYFGTPTDIDGNGRTVVFITPQVANDEVAAYVWSGDFVAEESCSASNEGEYVFFNGSLIRSMDDDDANYQAFETLVHEMKHVVSLYQRLRASIRAGNQGRFQPVWVEEGAAEVAGNLSSREAVFRNGGPPPSARLTVEDLVENGSLSASPENYGVLLRMVRTIWYLWSQPNGVVVSPSGAHPTSSIYGSGWNFHRWLGDAYGDAGLGVRADAELFRTLTDSLTPPGTQGLRQVTGRGFQELLEEYALAIALHETGAPEPDRRFTTYSFLGLTNILCGSDNTGCQNPQPDGLYPWPVTERASERGSTVPVGFRTASYSGPIGPTGLRIHDLRSDGTGTGARVEITMDAPGRVVIARLR